MDTVSSSLSEKSSDSGVCFLSFLLLLALSYLFYEFLFSVQFLFFAVVFVFYIYIMNVGGFALSWLLVHI